MDLLARSAVVIDLWRGSRPEAALTGMIVTVDLEKKDAELKLLLGCTPEEAELAPAAHNQGAQGGMLVYRGTATAG